MPYTQDNRLIAIETPLGKDALLLTGFHGTEGLSTPFSFELDLLSENHSIPFKDIIGKNVAVSVVLANGGKRYFHGLISRFSQGRGGGKEGGDPRFSYYTATMVPWLWLLKKTADSRIFQNLSVPDIVEKMIIDFLEGDPDCPIITGRVYNGNNKPPNGLPGAGMVSGLKSNSTPGGGWYNKITMNDTTGKENITIHSQYDMNTTSEHDNTLTVHNNRTSTIDVDDTETVGNNQTINIGVNQMETIGNDQTNSIANN